ncbi:beta-phosphoglucomutase family hydrolase [Nesterenkonia natronophila]|uniref:Beta-phosphoglucomutase family hydrolase n=1 Tax=Nesterenkonia natronophila TaxID=2174932 RepID=A0A3A4F3P4_9MICC|nr:beta-phosphoglucomutase family hydrolase [Nesterenkonia natronophila]RJN32478.1 beta-phosphoglucomutase family hydrolase [Nesterenkonia natronophila]
MHPFENPFRHSAEAKRHALRHFRAVLFDMDGVVTDTAGVHFTAWKELFDASLAELAGTKQPEFTQEDYLNYVDGRPREEGVRTLLSARGVHAPEGSPGDPTDVLSVHGLAARKQVYFQAVLDRDGVEVFGTTVDLIRRLRADGIPTALVTSSRNGREVLRRAGLQDIFDTIVDGTDALELKLPGKPNPHMFLYASAQLKVEPEDAIVVEDAVSGVQAGRAGNFGMVVGLNRGGDPRRLKDGGADIVVTDLSVARLHTRTTKPFDPNWVLTYDSFEPREEPTREVLCHMANGYWGTRASYPGTSADATHYPGNYIAGVFNRLKTDIMGKTVETEHMVNIPDWTFVQITPEAGNPLLPGSPELLDYCQDLDMRRGLLTRVARYEDLHGRRTKVTFRQFQTLAGVHLAAMEIKIEAENWSGNVNVRSMIEGRVANRNVAADRELAGNHLRPVNSREMDGETVLLETETNQSRVQIAVATRTSVRLNTAPVRRPVMESDLVAGHDISLSLTEGEPVVLEKIGAASSSHDHAVSTVWHNAVKRVQRATSFRQMLTYHEEMWGTLWHRFAVSIGPGHSRQQLALNLHTFHMLQTAFGARRDLDASLPARGLSGEGYRGHLFWDELFMYPMLTLRRPELTRGILMYRFRRLGEARAAARAEGYAGAMFPWQAGSDGREETPTELWNPRSQMWMPDHSHRQRHISLAVAYSVLQYFEATQDYTFLSDYGAELLVEVSRFFVSMTEYDAAEDRYSIDGVMGPDEYHDGYPETPGSGLKNNAYTNVLASWMLRHTAHLVRELDSRDDPLSEWLDIFEDELVRWEHISRRLRVPFHEDGIISQFEGYEDLLEFDWATYKAQYGNIGRLDLILQAEGDSSNRYKLSKQADVLMLCYLFSADELINSLRHMGYELTMTDFGRTIEYYLARSSHGSTLSRVVHGWVAARFDRAGSWNLFREALEADLADTQGGTTREGIHLGAMAGTVDMVIRCYGGVETRADALWLRPLLPDELPEVTFRMRYRNQPILVRINHNDVTLNLSQGSAQPIDINVEGKHKLMEPGEVWTVKLEHQARAHETQLAGQKPG